MSRLFLTRKSRIHSNEKVPSGCLGKGVKGFIASIKKGHHGEVSKMSATSRREVLEEARLRFGGRSKWGAAALLDENCVLCGYERKYRSSCFAVAGRSPEKAGSVAEVRRGFTLRRNAK